MLNLQKQLCNVSDAWVMQPGHCLGVVQLLFEKVEDSVVEAQIAKLTSISSTNTQGNVVIAGSKAETSFDEFSKMDIRVGTILEAERVPKTDKLLKLLIDTGFDKRTVVSGIAGFFEPSMIIGKKVSILVNLAPRKIKGIESKGMILMAENSNGELDFVVPNKESINDGSVIK